jgi:hypothetical protein
MGKAKRRVRRDLMLRKQAFQAIKKGLDEPDYIKRTALERKAIRLLNEARKWRKHL